jgi:hypothetical protein
MKTEPKDRKIRKKVKDVKCHWCCHLKSEDFRLNPTKKYNRHHTVNNNFRQQPAD